jgi:hypothetical protein
MRPFSLEKAIQEAVLRALSDEAYWRKLGIPKPDGPEYRGFEIPQSIRKQEEKK